MVVLVAVGGRDVEVGIDVSVDLGVKDGTGVEVEVGSSRRGSRVKVGSIRKPNMEKGVAVVCTVETDRSVTTTTAVGEETWLPVTGNTIGLGTISPRKLAARATAVLFILVYD
jgi:hypothetical protein